MTGLIIMPVVTALNAAMTGALVIFTMKQIWIWKRRMMKMSNSKITTIFKGEYVQVDLVDETIELTVENNVYSRSESLELLEELKRACAASRNDFGTAHHETYSQQMQDELEPIEEPFYSKAKLYDELGVMSSGYYESYPNHLPRLIEEMEDE
jgi:hypothetical protein